MEKDTKIIKVNKTYCEFCDEICEYHTENERVTEIFKGQSYSYTKKIAKCNKCGNETYIGEVNDYNLKALYNEYYKANGQEDRIRS